MKTLLVCGFGRCGSSLAMQMLDAGGMPVVGEFPSYEPPESMMHISGDPISADWLARYPGHAYKILDPQRARFIPPGQYVVLWLNRDPEQQARSHEKLIKTLMPGLPFDRDMRRRFARSYPKDRALALEMLETAGATVKQWTFEDIIVNPMASAIEMVNLVTWRTLDPEKMAAAVKLRTTMCAPNMALELSLIQEKAATAGAALLARNGIR